MSSHEHNHHHCTCGKKHCHEHHSTGTTVATATMDRPAADNSSGDDSATCGDDPGGTGEDDHRHSHHEGHQHNPHCPHEHEHGHHHEGHGHDHGGEEGNPRRDIIEVLIAGAVAAVALLFIQNTYIQAALLLGAIVIAGRQIIWYGIKSIVKLDFNELALMTIAAIAACAIGEYTEALLVTALFRIGEMLEDIAVARSRRAVEAITQIIPDNANLLGADGSSQVINARDLRPGQQILIKSGERVPTDCLVLSGSSAMDSSSLTGESAPREVAAGDKILSGMVNVGGILVCQTTETLEQSTASRIVKMVQESAAQKGSTEKMISRFARAYTPVVVAAAALIAILPPLLGFGAFAMWLSRALVFLVASCPCSLVIATPLAYFSGIGACSQTGVLVKGSRYMEALAHARAVVLDKTGTLTTGVLSVGQITTLNGHSADDILVWAAACEGYSNHPIAKAVVAAAGNRTLPAADNCEEITSYGMAAQIDGVTTLCGSARLMARFGVDMRGQEESGALFVARDGVLAGVISISDTPRDDAKAALEKLRSQGIDQLVMLTGDSAATAQKTAAAIGINQVRADLLPQDKVTAFVAIQEALEAKTTALFVGDGINDAPVLARADVGIAMGMGSDAAIESADVVLLNNRLSALPQAIGIARRTGKLARFNIAFSLAIKLIVFVLAFFGMATMWMAVFADVGVTLLAVLNAARALRFR